MVTISYGEQKLKNVWFIKNGVPGGPGLVMKQLHTCFIIVLVLDDGAGDEIS